MHEIQALSVPDARERIGANFEMWPPIMHAASTWPTAQHGRSTSSLSFLLSNDTLETRAFFHARVRLFCALVACDSASPLHTPRRRACWRTGGCELASWMSWSRTITASERRTRSNFWHRFRADEHYRLPTGEAARPAGRARDAAWTGGARRRCRELRRDCPASEPGWRSNRKPGS